MCKPDDVALSSSIVIKNKSESSTYTSDDDDSDDEIGRMIYNSSETAKARAVAVEAANNNGTLSNSLRTTGSNHSITITGTKRKSDSVQDEQNKKKVRKICSIEGCTKIAQRGGVCWGHGAKDTAKRCSHVGCTNHIVKGGVCMKHGAKAKICRHEGCTNNSIKGGVCIRHGAKKKLCSHEGCTNRAKKGGVCISHGAKRAPRKRCSQKDVPTMSRKEGCV